jgi:hypothetical protein
MVLHYLKGFLYHNFLLVCLRPIEFYQYGTTLATNGEAHGGIRTLHGDIKVAKQGAIRFQIKVAWKQLDPMFTFH